MSFNIPSLNESHPVSDKHDASLIVSEVVFNNPCFIESQPESLFTTGGVTVGVDSFFEQEYIIENIERIKISFFNSSIFKNYKKPSLVIIPLH